MNTVHCMNNLVELMIETDGLPDIRKGFFVLLSEISDKD